MACPFIEDPVDKEAALHRRELHLRQERILRPQVDFFVISPCIFI